MRSDGVDVIEVPAQARAYFQELGLEQVWLLDVSDASEHVYLVSPDDFRTIDSASVETELIRILGIKVWVVPVRGGVAGRLVYQRDA